MSKEKSVGKEPETTSAFSAEERAAMKAHIEEYKAERQPGRRAKAGNGEADVLAALNAMPEKDRMIGERIHAIVKATAPGLAPKTWYGMPAYANEDGKVVCFFQGSDKFKTRYATFGFTDQARLDEGVLWPTAFAIADLTDAEVARLTELVRKAT